MNYYIISLKHTKRRDRYISLWRPDDKGYAYPIPWAGEYPQSRVMDALDYYNSGCSNVAVPCEVLDAVAVAPEKGLIDGDAGPVIANTGKNWALILASVIQAPKHEPRPQYRGAPRLAA